MAMTEATTQLPTDPDGATGKLCTWVQDLKLEDIPIEVQTRAKHLMLDGLACLLLGAHLPWSEKAAKVMLEMDPSGRATVFGYDTKTTPMSAATLNSAFLQGFELDDWHSEAPLHSNAILLPALFAATEHLAGIEDKITVDGNAFLLSYLVGVEVGPRVGNGLYGANVIVHGWHSGSIFGPSASSTAICKMMSLPAHLIEDAVGIACTQAGGLMSAQFGSEVKRMQHGFAARNGLLAALLARGGYVGIKKVYEEKFGGYLQAFGQGSEKDPLYKVDEITRGLSTTWQTLNVKLKPYASMAGTHGSIDCIKKLQEEHPAEMKHVENIKSVKLEMNEEAHSHGGWKAERPLTSLGAQMSNAYAAATQVIDHEVLPAEFRSDKLERDVVWDVVNKTTCETDAEFTTAWQQRATITFNDGQQISAQVKAAKGVDPALTNEEIVQKWRQIAKEVIEEERMTKIEHLCLNITHMKDMTELIALLAGKTKNPIA